MRQISRCLFLVLCGFVFSLGCNGDDPTSSRTSFPGPNPIPNPNPSPFAGDWTITFAGDCPGNGPMVIAEDGRISGNVATPPECEQLGGAHVLNGSVSGAGELNASIIEGRVSVGTLQGTFDGNSAGGTYDFIGPQSGSWSAVRSLFFNSVHEK